MGIWRRPLRRLSRSGVGPVGGPSASTGTIGASNGAYTLDIPTLSSGNSPSQSVHPVELFPGTRGRGMAIKNPTRNCSRGIWAVIAEEEGEMGLWCPMLVCPASELAATFSLSTVQDDDDEGSCQKERTGGGGYGDFRSASRSTVSRNGGTATSFASGFFSFSGARATENGWKFACE